MILYYKGNIAASWNELCVSKALQPVLSIGQNTLKSEWSPQSSVESKTLMGGLNELECFEKLLCGFMVVHHLRAEGIRKWKEKAVRLALAKCW